MIKHWIKKQFGLDPSQYGTSPIGYWIKSESFLIHLYLRVRRLNVKSSKPMSITLKRLRTRQRGFIVHVTEREGITVTLIWFLPLGFAIKTLLCCDGEIYGGPRVWGDVKTSAYRWTYSGQTPVMDIDDLEILKG